MDLIPFAKKLKESRSNLLTRASLDTLQVNIGKLCNQACHHCHVEAGPKRTEIMDLKTTERIIELLVKEPSIKTLDITGGAPELMPHFRMLVEEVRKLGVEVIDRCNISVLFEPGQEDTAQFLKDQGVQIVASLPCYSKDNVDKQRGRGVFDKSVKGLKILNNLGFGIPGSGLSLNLVFNPLGATLPPEQKALESDYKKELKELFGISFNSLFTITNLPVKRFLTDLRRQGKEEEYMQILLEAYNPSAVDSVMCRSQLSVGWDGKIYDCDFNQMLEMPAGGKESSVWSIQSFTEFVGNKISLANHCYACTAGAGSSCGGALV